MEDLSINISGTTATDLLINSGAGATAGSSYGDSTKSTCEVEYLIICNTKSGVTTVDLYIQTGGSTKMYLIKGVAMPQATSLEIPPFQFDRSTGNLVAVADAGAAYTITGKYYERKAPI